MLEISPDLHDMEAAGAMAALKVSALEVCVRTGANEVESGAAPAANAFNVLMAKTLPARRTARNTELPTVIYNRLHRFP